MSLSFPSPLMGPVWVYPELSKPHQRPSCDLATFYPGRKHMSLAADNSRSQTPRKTEETSASMVVNNHHGEIRC